MMLSIRSALLALVASAMLSGVLPAQAQRRVEFETEVTIPISLNYLLHVPAVKAGESLPLLVFLHGAGERGADIEKVKIHGPPKLIAAGKKFPFIVVSPQCERGRRWNADGIIKLIDRVVEEQPVDTDRVYVTGLSLGGFASWELAAKYPGRLAAIAPICGGGDPSTAAAMGDLPIWVFHGNRDRAVPIKRSRDMVDALRAAGSKVKYTVYPEAGHDSWTETYDNPALYSWFLSHRISDRTSNHSAELPTVSPGDVGVSAAVLQRIDDAVEGFIDADKIAGAVTMVARRGHIVQAAAYGKRDLAGDRPMELDTIFRIYSMTKPIVSAAAMILHDEGKLGLDDPVARYVPDLDDLRVYTGGSGDSIETEAPRRQITVRDLLRHTAGLTYGLFGDTPVDRHYRNADVLSREGTLTDMTRKLGKIPLLYQPGTRWVYSVSVDVVGRIVEVVSGRTLDEFLSARIFKPLDMVDSGFHVPHDKLDRFATNYGPSPGGGLGVIDAPGTSRYRTRPTFLSGGGGLVSTGRDYMRFCQMIAGGGELGGTRILRRETVALMTRNQLPDEAFPISLGTRREGTGFGLGFAVRVAKAGDPAARVGEIGWGGAASTHFWISPRDELVVVALSQHMPYNDRLQDAVRPIVYDAIDDSVRTDPPK